MWKGLIEEYKHYLPVTENTPALSLNEGNTPLIPLVNLSKELGIELYGKIEGANPTGSFKDRGMVFAVAKAIEEGSKIVNYENENLKLLAAKDAELLQLLDKGKRNEALASMTEFCSSRSQYLFEQWKKMENYVLVKYMDGNVKRQNLDGSFKDNGAGVNIPESPEHPKFRERWLRSIVKDHGEVIKVVAPAQ